MIVLPRSDSPCPDDTPPTTDDDHRRRTTDHQAAITDLEYAAHARMPDCGRQHTATLSRA